MATQEQRKWAARYLRTAAPITPETARAFDAVADELDPPAKREAVVQGVRFGYGARNPACPWYRFAGAAVPLRYETLTNVLHSAFITPTPDEYATLYALGEADDA